jgi:hypothetical protein
VRQNTAQELQLHRYKILHAKGPFFWNRFITVAEEQCEAFNGALTDATFEVRLDHPTKPFSLNLRGQSGVVGNITCILDAEALTVDCPVVPPRQPLSRAYGLKVDEGNNILIETLDGQIVTPENIVLDLIRYLSGI